MVHVGVDTKQALHNLAHYIYKVVWEWGTNLLWKYLLILKEILNPGHQVLDIVWGAALYWLHYLNAYQYQTSLRT